MKIKKIIITTIIISLLFNTKVIGRFYEKLDRIKVSSVIAQPIFKFEQMVETIDINNFNEESEKEYIFKIKNFEIKEENQKRISQVSFEVTIEILNLSNNFPVKYQLYDENKELILKENKSEKILIEKDIEFEKIYRLVVYFDKSFNMQNANNQSTIEILVKANQLLD